MSHNTPSGESGFSGLGISPKLLEILTNLHFVTPTPIQEKAIPVAIEGKDVIGIAQTGTGKTLAFSVPLIQHIARTKKRGLIIAPTRELAGQIDELLQKIGGPIGLRRTLLIGGASMGRQIQEIKRNPHVIIGTPGRIIDHLKGKTLKLHDIGILVLDEADRMLDMGFAPQIKQVLNHVPKQRQTLLFSATMPAEIVKIATQHMQTPISVEVARAGTVAERVEQELFIIRKDQKNRLLDKLLGEYSGTVLVFSRTKHGARKICRAIRNMDHSAAEIHSNLTLGQRKKSLEGFKNGTFRVLVATDIAARGIDVTNIELVINYDLPDNPEDYVHRVGRTGRAGKVGKAITFITPEQRSKIKLIERLVRSTLAISPLPELPADRIGGVGMRKEGNRTYFSHPRNADHGRDRRSKRGEFPRRSRTRHSGGGRSRQARVHL